MVWKNSLDIKNIYDKNHKAETFYGSAEKLGKMINISRNCWEKTKRLEISRNNKHLTSLLFRSLYFACRFLSPKRLIGSFLKV